MPVFLLAAAVAVGVEAYYQQLQLRNQRRTVATNAAGAANAVMVAVNQRLALLAGLHAFLEVNWDRPGLADDFAALARRLQAAAPGIRTLQWIRDGIIRQTYPLEGNEAVLGYDLRTDPRSFIREDLARAERSGGTVLSGPTELLQGGLGVIGRAAIRGTDGTLLGVAAVVLDLPPILEAAAISVDSGIRVALRSEAGGVFHGDSAVFAEDPALAVVPLPEGAWHLAAVPMNGWGTTTLAELAMVRGVLALVVGLITLVTWLYLSRRAARLREEQERERRKGEEKFTRLFALSPDGAMLTRVSDGLILEANRGAEAALGYPREALVGQTTLALGIWHAEGDRVVAIETMRRLGLVQNFPAQFRTRGGQVRDGLYSGRLVEVNGELCLLSLFRDITDQKQLEAQLMHAQKLEAVGRLAGGVAHDFNNLITAITGYTELLQAGLAKDDPRRADTAEILRASGRAAQLTQQLLAFARRQLVQPRVVDLNRLVRDTTNLLQRLLGEQIALVTRAPEEPLPVLIDPGQFEQILVNLAVNARDAMPNGGRLEVLTHRDHERAALVVADNGLGMSSEVRAQAFEPFFTTKGPGKGTGLGLATVYGIVRQSGGRIDLASEAGQGTSFTIIWPVADGPLDEVAVPTGEVSLPGGSETILIAEDDPQVRRLAERTLRAAGYLVHVAAEGAQALAMARGISGVIHLLVTDVVMPGMSGQELAVTFLRERPESRVLFISGYAEDVVARQGLRDAGPAFLPKPFTPAELAGRVRELLDAPAQYAA